MVSRSATLRSGTRVAGSGSSTGSASISRPSGSLRVRASIRRSPAITIILSAECTRGLRSPSSMMPCSRYGRGVAGKKAARQHGHELLAASVGPSHFAMQLEPTL